MKCLVTCWFLAMVAHGAEVVGWRLPLDWLITPRAQEEATRDLKAPPEASAFFEEGDRLVDVRAALNKVLLYQNVNAIDPFAKPEKPIGPTFDGDWVVWNERSRMLVAKGDWVNLGHIEGLVRWRNMPVSIRCDVEFIPPEKDGVSSNELLIRSGEKGLRVAGRTSIDVQANLPENHDWVDLLLKLEHPVDEERLMQFEGWVTLSSASRSTVGFWTDGSGARWEMVITATPVTIDGTPRKDLVWMERDGVIERFDHEVKMTERGITKVELPDGLVVKRYNVAPDLFERLAFGRSEETDWIPFERLEVPEALRGTGLGGIDVIEPLRQNGVTFSHPLAMAGFYRGSSILVMVNTPTNQDLLEQIVHSRLYCPPSHLWAEVDWGDGSAGLRTRSGERSRLNVYKGEEWVSGIVIAANLGAWSEIVDVTYELVPLEGGFWKGSTTVFDGHEVELGSQKAAGEPIEATLKVSVTHGHEEVGE